MSDSPTAIKTGTLGGSSDPSENPRLKIASEKTGIVAQLSERLGEFCSSILVKETRQALKSRQFIWTYIVLLVAVFLWTVFGLTTSYDRYQVGKDLLLGFWFILGFPLGLIIPFTAYRSMAREFEDGTINLISITTMKPYQIVVGKFGSALLQMMIYLSVLAPCICFTYLLRGISLDQICLGLMVSVGGSICLTVLGLFLAGVFRSKAMGVGVSVLFVLLLGWLYYGWCYAMEETVRYEMTLDWGDPQFMSGFFALVAFFGSTAVLLLVAAASQISFASDNRATGIRIAMFVQQILFFAMLVMLMPIVPTGATEQVVFSMMMVAGHYWLIMGLLMIGESSHISRRVQRTLPRTVATRSFFSLFTPGSGRGFLFAVANLWTCLLVCLLIAVFSKYLVDQQTRELLGARWGIPTYTANFEMVASGLATCFYVTWFLSLMYLVNRIFFEKRKLVWSTGVGPTISLLLGAVFMGVLSIAIAVIHYNYFNSYRGDTLSPVSALSWYITAYGFMEGATAQTGFVGLFTALAYLSFVAQAIVFIVIAFALASKELLVRPIAVPRRVEIETEKPKKNTLAPGESIDEIFGELKKS